MSTVPTGQLVHWLAVALQVAQAPSQAWHVPAPVRKVPSGHAATQVEPSWKGRPDEPEQAVQALLPAALHVSQLPSHDWHDVPSE